MIRLDPSKRYTRAEIQALIDKGQEESQARAEAQAEDRQTRRNNRRQARREEVQTERDNRLGTRAVGRLERLHKFLKLPGAPATLTKASAQAHVEAYKASSQPAFQRRGFLIERLLTQIPD